MITLSNFTNTLDKKQILKGQHYFMAEAVDNLNEQKNGYWQAEVLGTEIYHVRVQLRDIEIISTGCDCPHDDLFCKHVVAVLFALQDELDIIDEAATKQQQKKTATKKKQLTVDDLLKQVNEAELKKFVKEAAQKNKDFYNLFMLRFQYTNEADGYKKYAAMIAGNAKAYARRGFIEYGDSTKALKAAIDIAGEAGAALEKGNYRIVFDASRAIIQEVQQMIHYMDDSNGLAGDCIERSFSYLHEMAVNADVPVLLRSEIFEYAFTEFDKPHYRDFGFDHQMLELLVASATENEQLQRTLQKIEQQLGLTENEYREKELLDAKIELLNKYGKEKEALQIVLDNLQHWEFREETIKKFITQKDYEQAKKLAQEAFENEKKKQWRGDTFRWEKWLLTVAITESDTVTIRRYSKQFYSDRFDQQYYNIYKKTFTENEWTNECNKWIEWFISKSRITIPQLYALANIYIAEKYFDRLLVLLQKNPEYEFAHQCNPFLKDTYEKELTDVYRIALLNYAQNNTGRNFYVELRKRLKEVQQLPSGKPLVKELVEYFLRMYKNRPAMIDELNKINT
jgi:hypothetical protein